VVDKLKIIAQTLKGYGLHDDGVLVEKAALALEQAHTMLRGHEAAGKHLMGVLDTWKARAEGAEEALRKARTVKRPPPDDEITGKAKK